MPQIIDLHVRRVTQLVAYNGPLGCRLLEVLVVLHGVLDTLELVLQLKRSCDASVELGDLILKKLCRSIIENVLLK